MKIFTSLPLTYTTFICPFLRRLKASLFKELVKKNILNIYARTSVGVEFIIIMRDFPETCSH